MGDFDYVKVVLDRLGEMKWMQVAIKPAKPLAFGLLNGVPIFVYQVTRFPQWFHLSFSCAQRC